MQVHGYYRKLQENWPCQSIPGHVYMLKTLLVHNIRQQIWQWNFSRVANIKTILWECNWADLKNMLVSVLLPAQPPKKNCHSEGIFFSPKPWQALLPFHQKLYFQSEFSLTPNLEYFTLTFCLWLQLFAKSQQKSIVKLQLFLEGSIFTPIFKILVRTLFSDTDNVALTFIWNILPLLRTAFWTLYYL